MYVGSIELRLMEAIYRLVQLVDTPDDILILAPVYTREIFWFQKHLRLRQARQLMLVESIDAASAAFQVGYESPSQFSREYSRLLGSPPVKDIQHLKLRYV